MFKCLKQLFTSSTRDPIIKTIEVQTRSTLEILNNPPRFNPSPDRAKVLLQKLALARGMLYSVKYDDWTMAELDIIIEQTKDDFDEDLS